MSQCPLPTCWTRTLADGMPYDKLREVRAAGPVIKLEDPITGVPYWAVTRVAEMDYVSKNPTLFRPGTFCVSHGIRSVHGGQYP